MLLRSNPPFWWRWLTTTLAVMVAAFVVPGIQYDSSGGLVLASLLLGILNSLVRPALILFALPLVVLSLGFFLLIINALLLYAVGSLVPSFHVTGFWPAFWGGLVISVVGFIANPPTPVAAARKKAPPDAQTRNQGPPTDASGPIIDV